MALTNFSLPFGALAQPTQTHWGVTLSPLHPVHQLASNTNNLLYSPADHQQQDDGNGDDSAVPPPGSDYYKNDPYAPPQIHQQPQQQQQQPYQYNNNNNNNNNNRRKNANTYLPPIPPPGVGRTTQFQTGAYHHQQQQQQQHHQQITHHYNSNSPQNGNSNNNNNNNIVYKQQTTSATSSAAATSSSTSTRSYGEGTYSSFSNRQQQQQQQHEQQPRHHHQQQQQFFHGYSTNGRTTTTFNQQLPQPQPQPQPQQQQQLPPSQTNYVNKVEPPNSIYGASVSGTNSNDAANADSSSNAANAGNEAYPERPPGFTRVQAGQGSRTQVHAVLDYDADEGEEDYYDENDQGETVNKDGSKKSSMPTVTPIQGPIFLKNDSVPVVPLFSYPTINNGSFVQIPIWWTALSVALGLDVRGDIIKGVPCIKRFHQLFCPTAGNSYPIDKIERFIDENKALMRRMYGDFEMNMDDGGPRQQTKKRRRRFIDEPDIFIPPGVFPAVIPPDDIEGPHRRSGAEHGDSYFGKLRNKRQSSASANQNRGGGGNISNKSNNFGAGPNGPNNPGSTGSSTGRLDACESKIEIVTPYWASNSAGKIRAIVNTQHFEQAIHQEVCSKTQTPRCERDCGCEQKYKWHRLLAYDPDNDCKGIFMDWFLFPSCCVCRCNP